jgi:hypothetical protein
MCLAELYTYGIKKGRGLILKEDMPDAIHVRGDLQIWRVNANI